MKKYITGSLIKGRLDSEFQLGPIYDLKRDTVKTIVHYLKKNGLWTRDFLFSTNAILSDDLLFDDLKILDPALFMHGQRYSIEFNDFSNYLCDGLPDKDHPTGYLTITSKSLRNEKVLSHSFLPNKFQLFYHDLYSTKLKLGLKPQLMKSDTDFLLRDRDFHFMYEFNFDKFRYYLEYDDPWSYIIDSDEEWFKLK